MVLRSAILVLSILTCTTPWEAMAAEKTIPPVPKLKTFHLEVPIAHEGKPAFVAATEDGFIYGDIR